ncbi:hypothetical protein GN956_G3222 [Arapaima gigas]
MFTLSSLSSFHSVVFRRFLCPFIVKPEVIIKRPSPKAVCVIACLPACLPAHSARPVFTVTGQCHLHNGHPSTETDQPVLRRPE